MAKYGTLILIIALCVLPAFTVARVGLNKKSPFSVRGRVYCDPCRAGFETRASTYLQDAKVKLQCRHRHTQDVLYEDEAVTDSTGSYKFDVKKDQKNNICETMLVSSSHKTCRLPDPGRDRSRVVLTNNNGIVSSDRYANNMGFMEAEPMHFCAQVMQQYQLNEEDDFRF